MFLEFRNNDTLHDDLILHFGGHEIVCDSYYFALDRAIEPDSENPDKIKKVLVRLLEQWYQFVLKAKSGEILYLPFDFSDEYVGCLRCEFQKENIHLSIGYLQGWEGWTFYPSNISEYVISRKYFIKSGDVNLELSKKDFIFKIKKNIEEIEKMSRRD